MKYSAFACLLSLCLACLPLQAPAAEPGMEAELHAIQQEWAVAKYQVPAGEQRVKAFEALEKRAAQFVQANPNRAEPLIWQGIVLSTYAGAKGGLGALGLAKRARTALEAALRIDPQALSGSAHTSLGALYHKVPGFPIGFGSDAKAREHFEQALAIDPNGIDVNFFYGELLLDKGELVAARQHLEKARNAPPRPGRELADSGRREEIDALLAKAGSAK